MEGGKLDSVIALILNKEQCPCPQIGPLGVRSLLRAAGVHNPQQEEEGLCAASRPAGEKRRCSVLLTCF